jgi:hypothetical protein
MSQEAARPAIALVGIVIVAALLLGFAYAVMTGILDISGLGLVDSTVASAAVFVGFLLTLPWVYRQAKQS